jgi:dTDP-4-amino-4,6-dideoxygalactose transaminase
VVPLHKKGDINNHENYRRISLLNTGYKIYASIIKNKLTKFYENLIGEEQNGFHKGRSYSDGYFSLKLIIEKHKEFNIKTHLAFIDFKKAFDKVNRNKLMEILKADNIPNQLAAIYNIYKNNLIAKKNGI